MLLRDEKDDDTVAVAKTGHAARPRGSYGRALGWMWLRINGPMNRRAVAALELQHGESVLDIG